MWGLLSGETHGLGAQLRTPELSFFLHALATPASILTWEACHFGISGTIDDVARASKSLCERARYSKHGGSLI